MIPPALSVLEGLPLNLPSQARGPFLSSFDSGPIGSIFSVPKLSVSSPRIMEGEFAQDAQTLSGSSTCLAKVVALDKSVWSS